MQIFTYWDSEKLPLLNQYCIYTWKKHNPEFSTVILHDSNIHQYVKTFPVNYDKLIIQHKTDYIRTYLLYHYGGIWIDNTIILRGKLGDIFDLNIKDKLQLIGGDPDRIIIKSRQSIYKNRYFHNNFMCSLKSHNELVKSWLDNFSWFIENLNPATNPSKYPPEYFKDSYRNIKNGRDFVNANFTYYLTHMNVLTILITKTDIYNQCFIKIKTPTNFLSRINDKFEYDDSVIYIKINQALRRILTSLIENNILCEHQELNRWIDMEYFKNK